ncbi:hypothetical protein GTA08_BOTSDO08528 [Neofusicoccum parvum]|uniref:Uncharacterized protein n=1 Tax=Neofusicoccum parvum TaxID=310453 RepID=A0ACB5SPH5_9PEZI|nr:hypothetical protein GTA08_BOTSDO08528 [Neofusicoccum parvum]
MAKYCGKNVCSPVDFLDVDIVGRGVVASFMVTVFITVLLITVGYVFDFLPEARTNTVDEIIVRFPRKGLSSPWRKKAASALEQFVLSLSDQQLVTGTAILLAVFAGPCDVSVISFRTATSMAWFSSTTHLTTLSILQGYFQHEARHWVRNVRVVVMLIFMVLLVSAEFLSESGRLVNSDNWGQSFGCVVTQRGPNLAPLVPSRAYRIFSIVILMIWLCAAYVNRLAGLYSPYWKALRSWPYRACAHALGLNPNPPSQQKTALTFKVINQRIAHAPRFPRTLLVALSLIGPVQHELSNSFFYEIIWSLFGLSFGITQTVRVLSAAVRNHPKTQPSFRRITGFGQLLPVLLLALPVLAAMEASADVRVVDDGDPARPPPSAPAPPGKQDVEQPAPRVAGPPYSVVGFDRTFDGVADLPGFRTVLALEAALWVGATQSFAVLVGELDWMNLWYLVPVYGVAGVLYVCGTFWFEVSELSGEWKRKKGEGKVGA